MAVLMVMVSGPTRTLVVVLVVPFRASTTVISKVRVAGVGVPAGRAAVNLAVEPETVSDCVGPAVCRKL